MALYPFVQYVFIFEINSTVTVVCNTRETGDIYVEGAKLAY